jgi:hypothetical protein
MEKELRLLGRWEKAKSKNPKARARYINKVWRCIANFFYIGGKNACILLIFFVTLHSESERMCDSALCYLLIILLYAISFKIL